VGESCVNLWLDLSLDFEITCEFSVVGFMARFAIRILLFWRFIKSILLSFVKCTIEDFVKCNIEIICLLNQSYDLCDGLFDVKCPKAQFQGSILLLM
jgi:hypothetical protein